MTIASDMNPVAPSDAQEASGGEVLSAYAIANKEQLRWKASIYRFERGDREPSLLLLLEYSKIAAVSLEKLVDDDLELPKRLGTRH